MSITTRPPGDAARPEPSRPVVAPPGANASTSPTAVPPTAASPVATPPPGLRTPTPEGAAALRVFVEEVRAAVQAQLQAATRPEALPPLADADPGNAVAALLRWLRAATAGTPLPPATIEQIVAEAHARATEQLQRAAAGAPRPEAGPPARGGAAPGEALRAGAPSVAALRAAGADAPALVRETLAAARDLVLRALAAPAEARTAAAGAAGSGERSAPSVRDPGAAGGGASSARPAGDGAVAVRAATPAGAGIDARAPGGAAAATNLSSGGAAGMPPRGTSAAVATPVVPGAPPASTAPRVPPIDPAMLLRSFVDEIRVELVRAVGTARLPSGPLPLVTDAQGTQLGPGLLRWLTSAVGEKGVPLAPLQDAVRAAHARAVATLPEPMAPGATPAAVLQARDALLAVRDHVLRGLGAAPERLEAPGARDAVAPRVDARVEAPVVDPRGVPVGSGALVPREDRVEEIGARPRSRPHDDGSGVDAPDDERATDVGAGTADLQGPMDCIRRYFDAYLAGDSTAYAAQWVYPACIWSDGRWSAYANAAACARGNDEYTRAARAAGVGGGRIVMLRVEPTTEDVAVVHAVFTREGTDGSVLAEAEAAYTTVRTATGWRVAVCVVKK